MKKQLPPSLVFSLPRPARGRLIRGLVPALLLAISTPLLHAAAISHAGRSLQAVIDLVDYNPLAGDETADFDGAGIERPTFSGEVQTTNNQNDNSSTTTTAMTSTVDTAGLKFGGSCSSRFDAQLNFDASDAASGAFINGHSFGQYSVGFTIARSGTVKLSGTLQAAGAGGATIRLERWDGSGIPLWNRGASNSTEAFSADIPLTQGSYLVIVTAGTGTMTSQTGPITVAGTARFDFSGQIVEATSGKPGKPRK